MGTNALTGPGVHLTEQVHGQQVLDVCRVRGIAVPDEVAVLG